MTQLGGEARIALDLWRAEREGAAGLVRRQELRLRLDPKPGADVEKVWREVISNLEAYLAEQHLANVDLVRASEPPEQSARSGKFRQVFAGHLRAEDRHPIVN